MILLFNPPAPSGRGYTREGRCTQEAGVWGTQWPPLSLATAAALLRGDGLDVTLRDYPAAGLGQDALAADLWALRPVFAIWTTGTPTFGFDIGLARLVRECAPKAVTAVLGTHVSAFPEEALAESALDVVIRGEPEGVIRDLGRLLIEKMKGGKAAGAENGGSHGTGKDPLAIAGNGGRQSRSRQIAAGCANIPGIAWRDADGGTIRHNPDAPLLAPEAIPAPSWDGLDLDGYRLPLKGRRFLIVAPVRGCPWHCSFCTAPLYYGHRLRRRPVARVADEIADDIACYGVREFFIWADTFTADRDYVRELCRTIIERKLRISWTCNSRVDTIDEETLALMKEAGLWMISYGLESADDAILAASRKGITAAQSRRAVEIAHHLGIRTAGHFIFGLPGETRETMAETLAFALSLPLDIAQFYAAAPFPGTALYDEAMEKGWLATSGAAVARPSATISQNTAALALPGLPAVEVDAFRRRAFRRFYLRPSAAACVLSMVEPGSIAALTPLLRRFLRWIG
ncbi:MAG: radical SAM protein [Deltaproteobacteria bacterium]|nr:radical SAM protein [Deltaproteobacteria bacterium]